VHKTPAVSCQFFRTSSSHCIPEVMEDFDVHLLVYSMPFWNKFIVDGIVRIKENRKYNLALFL
jgi:hypothetical protein